MFDVERSEWLRGATFVAPSLVRKDVDTIVIHYIGTASPPKDSYAWMLNTHNMTMGRTPSYSFMYNAYVDPAGLAFQGRGLEFKNAANKGSNEHTFSICVGVAGQEPVNEKQISTIRRIVAGVRNVCAGGRIVGHRDVGQTSCPGAGVYGQVRLGLFEPVVPPPPIQKGTVDMLILEWRPGSPQYTGFVWTGTGLSWLVNGHALEVLLQGGVKKVTISDAQLKGVIESSLTASECPTTLPNDLRVVWERNRLQKR